MWLPIQVKSKTDTKFWLWWRESRPAPLGCTLSVAYKQRHGSINSLGAPGQDSFSGADEQTQDEKKKGVK